MAPSDDLKAVFASMEGQRIPGGCDHCDAYQEMKVDDLGIFYVYVCHDDWCAFLQARRKR